VFKFRCVNCNSVDVELYRDRQGYGQDYLNCRCGWQFYGTDRIVALYESQKAAYEESLIVEEPVVEEAPPEPLPEPSEDLCAWEACDKSPQGGRAERRKGSKYCSRDCSNRNARYRYQQRAKKEAA